MRCKKHLQDLTSTVGVCTSCLRERLEPLVQAQRARVCPRSSVVAAVSDDIKKPEHDSGGLNFLWSVSPYVFHRKTDRDRRLDRSFYSMPQVGPNFSDGACDGGKMPPSKKRLGKFWNLSNLFQSRSNKSEISSREPCDPSSATSPSWFSTILPSRRQNKRRNCEQSDHGISTEANFTEESPQRRKNTAEARRWRLGSAGKRVSGMVICLSPLVGASQKKELSVPFVVGGPTTIYPIAETAPGSLRILEESPPTTIIVEILLS